MTSAPEDLICEAVDNAEQVQPDLQAEVADLAKLSPLEYDQVREQKAKGFGVRVGTLDKEVANARPTKENEAKGRAIELHDFELWEQPVRGDEVLDEVREHILRHMVIDEHQADAVILWAAHVHLFDRFAHSPRLMITAPDAECGKSLLMVHIVGDLIPKPLVTELMKAAPFFRLAEEAKPSYLIDEMDVFIEQDSDLLAAVNNGWEPHGGVLRCIGDDNEVRKFSTHTPVAMAGIELHKKLPATTVSRSVVVHLERAADDELDEDDIYETRKHRVGILETGRRLARWCADAKQEIAGRDPTLPPKVRNRLADKWRPLFAIAEVAGSHWPDRARAALFAQPDLSEPSKGLQLLIDIRDVLDDKARNIATEDLIGMLANLDEAPWADYNFRQRDPEERRIQPRQLSGLLKRYGIGRGTVRTIERPNSAKGYRERDLAQAWKRYLPKEPLEKESQSHSSVTSTTCVGHKGDTAQKSVTPESACIPCNKGACDPVTPSEGGTQNGGDMAAADANMAAHSSGWRTRL